MTWTNNGWTKKYPHTINKGTNRMELNNNQSALILTESEDGEITVDLASSDLDGLTGSICQAIAKKIIADEQFQNDLMDKMGE
jgi:hypothetical protein